MEILIPVLIVGAVALIAGVGLGVANHFFSVKGDERAEAIQKELPGANCGACGYSGCSGYAAALSEFDRELPEIISLLRDGDLLIITADHGCDPADESTDHTRECIPMLMYRKGEKPKNLGTITGFDFVGKTICELLDVKCNL